MSLPLSFRKAKSLAAVAGFFCLQTLALPAMASGLGGAGAAMEGFEQGRREAQGRAPLNAGFQDAMRTGVSGGSGGVAVCWYKTYAGFTFSINSSNGPYDCPQSVKVNPDTMQVRRD